MLRRQTRGLARSVKQQQPIPLLQGRLHQPVVEARIELEPEVDTAAHTDHPPDQALAIGAERHEVLDLAHPLG